MQDSGAVAKLLIPDARHSASSSGLLICICYISIPPERAVAFAKSLLAEIDAERVIAETSLSVGLLPSLVYCKKLTRICAHFSYWWSDSHQYTQAWRQLWLCCCYWTRLWFCVMLWNAYLVRRYSLVQSMKKSLMFSTEKQCLSIDLPVLQSSTLASMCQAGLLTTNL